MDTVTVESINLTLPLNPRHAATVRVVAASLAADCGFTVDEIDDFRLGINEAVAVLTEDADENASEQSRRLEVEFRVEHRRIDVVVRRRGEGSPAPPDELAERILSTVVDHHEFTDGAFHLSKSTGDPSAAIDAD